jgi:hypothetical protein
MDLLWKTTVKTKNKPAPALRIAEAIEPQRLDRLSRDVVLMDWN